MAKIGQNKGKPTQKYTPAGRRVSPLKPGLSGARNWATAQVRGARYSKRKFSRLVLTATLFVLFVLWLGLWLGGFMPNINSSYHRFTKDKLVGIGFVVKYVDVVGEGRVREDKVREMLGVQPGDYLFDMDIVNAQARIQSLGWVDTAVVRRLWPNRIVVHINERRPYALWQNNQQIRVIDKTGVVILAADVQDFTNLPYFVGHGAQQNVQDGWDMLQSHPEILSETQAMVRVGDRRWNVILSNGKRILLPEKNPQAALQRFDTYNQKHGLLGLDLYSIDMRVKGRLTLRPQAMQKYSDKKPNKIMHAASKHSKA